MSIEQRNAVITEAQTWLRTPHHNGACIKGVGVDCGLFPWSVYHAVGLMPEIPDDLRYSPQFHLHKDEEWYLKLAHANGKELEVGVLPKRGDFVLYKIGRIFSHGAIVIDWPQIIHAYIKDGVTYARGNAGRLEANKRGVPTETKFFTLWPEEK